MALPSKMWPSPAQRERKRAWELDGSVTPFAPWWPGGLEAFATDRGARPRKVQVVEVGGVIATTQRPLGPGRLILSHGPARKGFQAVKVVQGIGNYKCQKNLGVESIPQ